MSYYNQTKTIMKQLTLKKLFVFPVLSLLLVLGCKDAPKEIGVVEVPEITEFSDADFKILWQSVEALWEQRDSTLIHDAYADNFTRISPGGTSSSVEELTKELNAVGVAFPDLELNLVRYDICGDMVVTHWSVDGYFTGEIAGLTGNGKPYSVPGVTIITVSNGKIVKDDSYWDTYAVFAQTGGYAIIESKPSIN